MSQAPQFKNLVELFAKTVERFADHELFGTRQDDGSWSYITYKEFGEMVNGFRGGLASLGIGKGDRVAVISDNRVEWAVGAYATYGLGACYVPMYQKQNAKDWEYIIRDCSAAVVLVANTEVHEKVSAFIGKIDGLKHVINFDGPADDATSYAALVKSDHEAPMADPEPSDLCGFIYTSGTTGDPKGVRLSHGNITSNVNAVQRLFVMNTEDRSLSFLPWAHSFGQTCELHCGFSYGISSAICDDVTKLVGYLGDVKPTLLFSVPRIFNKIYDGLNKKMAAGSPIKRMLFQAAMANANRRRELMEKHQTSGWVNFKHSLFDKLVFSKIRLALGGRLRFAFSGGAAISREVAEFIDNIGITVYEGYGLSETSPIATVNSPGFQKIGSVGKAVENVEIIIDKSAGGGENEGEILIKGPNVMQGYHNLPEQTKEALREDGAFRSGDLGWVDDEGFVYVTGRIKEQYKLENGKYVVPAPLEEQLKLSGYIDQVLVFGDNKPFNVAIIVPDVVALEGWAKAKGLEGDLKSFLNDPGVKELYTGELDKWSNDVFKGFEKVRDFRLITEEFSTDNDMLTPTLKLKRRNVLAVYQPMLDEIYTA
ncbi:MAG: long-chain fatty acid--CoA ligase [Proteobacteria bacterium]|nr:long-chain fatty acid--CoA ligase [Pseudomonadota bacterium]